MPIEHSWVWQEETVVHDAAARAAANIELLMGDQKTESNSRTEDKGQVVIQLIPDNIP